MFNVGTIVRLRRLELGLTQSKVCGKKISVTTLSRLEKNGQLPNKHNFEYIIDRLGIFSQKYSYLLSYEDKEVYDLRYTLESAYNKGDYKATAEILTKLKTLPNALEHGVFLTIAETLLLLQDTSVPNETKLTKAQNTVDTFCKDFSPNKIAKTLLMKKELMMLVALATAHYKVDDKQTALNILNELIAYINKNIEDKGNIAPIYARIMLCLSAYYIDECDYTKALYFCEDGLKMCIANDCGMIYFDKLLFNKARILFSQNQEDQANACLKQAYYSALSLGERADCFIAKINSYAKERSLVI
ncbi:MAG: helix-turn-helix domain-containing protein [Defluviitaleaceae bacterium]|nr:helix-turn-helix domain-containing protein [Defluviitaleaceae bacterium]